MSTSRYLQSRKIDTNIFNQEYSIKQDSDASELTEREIVFDIGTGQFTVDQDGWDIKYDPSYWGIKYYLDHSGNKTLQEALDLWHKKFLTLPDAVTCISTDNLVKYTGLCVHKNPTYPETYTELICRITDGKDEYRYANYQMLNTSYIVMHYKELLKIDEVVAANYIFKNECAGKTFETIYNEDQYNSWLHHGESKKAAWYYKKYNIKNCYPDVSKIAFKWVNK